MDITNIISGNVGRDYVSPEVKAEYDQLMEKIKENLAKIDSSSEDESKELTKEIEKALKQLNKLRDRGLEVQLKNDLDLLFTFFKAAGFDVNAKFNTLNPEILQALKIVTLDIGEGKKITIEDVLTLALDQQRHSDAAKSLGAVLLDFANSGYENYEKKVEELYDQIKLATEVINNLTELKKILNQVKVKWPENFKMPPTSINDIPRELLEKIKGMPGIKEKIQKGTIKDQDYVDWVKTNPQAYANLCEDYFKKDLGVTPEIQESLMINLFRARDNLIELRDKLIAAGDPQKEGSPADSLSKLLKETEKLLPMDRYPIGFPGEIPIDNIPLRDRAAIIMGVSSWIMAGQGPTGVIREVVDNAMSANENLSSEMSDKVKVENSDLQAMFEALLVILDSLNKSITSTAQKLSR